MPHDVSTEARDAQGRWTITGWHAQTKGGFSGGVTSVDVGSDYDILGKGFYFGSKEYAEQYGEPTAHQLHGKFATQQDWSAALAKHKSKDMAKQRAAARADLSKQGYHGIWTGRVGVVWDQSAIVHNARDVSGEARDTAGKWTKGGHDTPEFRKWFAGSKVVDAHGKPLRVYHGTTEDFNAFDPAHLGEGTGKAEDTQHGYFFASNPNAADQYTWKDGDQTGHVLPVYLSIKNPLTVKSPRGDIDRRVQGDAIRRAMEGGYDGVRITGVDTLGYVGDYWVALRPNQIKSAFNKKPTASPVITNAHDVTSELRDKAGKWTAGAPDTPEFKKWFEGSKVVTPEGDPKRTHGVTLRVYHGTGPVDFSAFDPEKVGSNGEAAGKGFYFSESPKIANYYAEAQRGSVIPAYLHIENPYDFDKRITKEQFDSIVDKLAASRHKRVYLKADHLRTLAESTFKAYPGSATKGMSGTNVYNFLSESCTDANAVLAECGYDGVTHESDDVMGTPAVYAGERGRFGRVWVAFKPEQIKSVHAKKFDPASPVITNKAARNPAQQVNNVNPERIDRTRTGMLRQAFSRELTRRMRGLLNDVLKLLVDEDAFGMVANVKDALGHGSEKRLTGYHGSSGGTVASRNGFTYFTPHAHVAKEFAGEHGKVHAASLHIKNPKYIDESTAESASYDGTAELAKSQGHDALITHDQSSPYAQIITLHNGPIKYVTANAAHDVSSEQRDASGEWTTGGSTDKSKEDKAALEARVQAWLDSQEQDDPTAKPAPTDYGISSQSHQNAAAAMSPEARKLTEESHKWEQTKPWNATAEDVQAGKYPGVSVGQYSGRSHDDAETAHHEDGRIVLTHKFFELKHEETRKAVMWHELGHQIADTMSKDGSDFKLLDMGVFPQELNGQTTPMEMISEGYSLLQTDRPYLDKHAPKLAAHLIERASALRMPLPATVHNTHDVSAEARDSGGKWTTGGLEPGASSDHVSSSGVPYSIENLHKEKPITAEQVAAIHKVFEQMPKRLQEVAKKVQIRSGGDTYARPNTSIVIGSVLPSLGIYLHEAGHNLQPHTSGPEWNEIRKSGEFPNGWTDYTKMGSEDFAESVKYFVFDRVPQEIPGSKGKKFADVFPKRAAFIKKALAATTNTHDVSSEARDKAGKWTAGAVATEDLEHLKTLVNGWPEGERRSEGLAALKPSKYDTVSSLTAGGKLVGVASYWKDCDTAGAEGVPGGQFIRLRNMATSEPGHGREMFKQVLKHAASKNAGLYLSSLESSRGFYEKLGMHEATGSMYYLTKDEVKGLTANVKFKGTDDKQIEAFRKWLDKQVKVRVGANADSDAWWNTYIKQAYRKGAERSYGDVKANKTIAHKPELMKNAKGQFVSTLEATPQSKKMVKMLASRTFTDLDGITKKMSNDIVRALVDGVITGKSKEGIAKDIVEQTKVSLKRATAITYHNITKCFVEGQLDALELMGVDKLGVAVEWKTSGLGTTAKGNTSPCKMCKPLENIILTIKEARGMFPRHLGCLCAIIPYATLKKNIVGSGGSGARRKKSKAAIEKSRAASLEAELPTKVAKGKPMKVTKRRLAQQKKLSSWKGAKQRIATKRPKPTNNEGALLPLLLQERINHLEAVINSRDVSQEHRDASGKWAAMGGQLASQQEIDDVEAAKNKHRSPQGVIQAPSAIEHIHPKHLVATQRAIVDSVLAKKRGQPIKPGSVSGTRHKGKVYLDDGHHTTASALLDKTGPIPVEVTDLDAHATRNGGPGSGPHVGQSKGLLHSVQDLSGASHGLIGMKELREHSGLSKAEFDRKALLLAKGGMVSLHKHDYVAPMSQEELSQLVYDTSGDSGGTGQHPKGAYYVGMALRRTDNVDNWNPITGNSDPGHAGRPGHQGGSAPSLHSIIENVTKYTGYTREHLKAGLGSDKKMRSKVEGSILLSGKAIPNAVTKLKLLGDSAKLKAITTGPTEEVLKQFSDTPKYDIGVLTGVKVSPKPLAGEAIANMATLSIGVGSTTRPGSYRHELGHVLRASLSGDHFKSKTAMTKAINEEFQKVKAKVAANPAGLKEKHEHEWYEQEYGVAGRRSLDNWEENFAEHYRLYHREMYRDQHEGGNGKFLQGYNKRHEGMAKIWNAHYTAAMIYEELQHG